MASYGEILLFVHEAKSGTLQEEMMKVVIGLCRILPYSQKPRGMVTTDQEIYWIQVELDEINQRVVYCTQEQLNFDLAKPKEHETYMCQMLEIFNRIAGILYYKQDHIDDILKFMHKLCDNLNRGRPDFVVRSLRETEGIFCMDTIV